MSKVVGIFVIFWAFIIPAPQIWSCHVTQEANFKILFSFLILHKVTKFLVEKLSTSEVICLKPHGLGGGEHPQSAFRVKDCSVV